MGGNFKKVIFFLCFLVFFMTIFPAIQGNNKSKTLKILISTGYGNSSICTDNFVKKLKLIAKNNGINIKFNSYKNLPIYKLHHSNQHNNNLNPDLIIAPANEMQELYKKENLLVKLTKVLDNLKNYRIDPKLKKTLNYNDNYYFFPLIGKLFLLLTNKKALKYLPEKQKLKNLTWKEFSQWAINIREKIGFGRLVFAGKINSSFTYQFGSCALSYGEDFPDLTSKGARKAWKFFEKIAREDAFIPNILHVGDCTDPMRRQEAWISIISNKNINKIYPDNSEQFLINSLPAGSKGKANIVKFTGFGIMKNSKKKELAKEFIKICSSAKIQLKLAKAAGNLCPSNMKTLDLNNLSNNLVKTALKTLKKTSVISLDIQNSKYSSRQEVKKIFDSFFQNYILTSKEITKKDLVKKQVELKKLTQ